MERITCFATLLLQKLLCSRIECGSSPHAFTEESKQCRVIVAARIELKDSGESNRCVTSDAILHIHLAPQALKYAHYITHHPCTRGRKCLQKTNAWRFITQQTRSLCTSLTRECYPFCKETLQQQQS
mmetsp:Transcript_23468/g.34608  ORF Transcript_23468/g.34608 Transcript_23468/m.34608 type:complete len:127 (+) Transcript_23468:75-455(+)